jgi:glycopeptide antibiotics resistance protein
MRNAKSSALSYTLLIYMCIIVILITLIPFSFRLPAAFRISWSANVTDVVTNIILFLPIGFLFKLSRRGSKDRLCVKALGMGILLSSAIEFTQLFIPGRYTSGIDVLTNGLGAWLGAAAFELLREGSRQDYATRLFPLELPLMNLVYLLIPLMWLDGLSTGGEGPRLGLLFLLGLIGCGVLASIYMNRLKQEGRLTPNRLSLFTMSWFIVAALPALLNFPVRAAGFAVLLSALMQIPARFPLQNKRGERRFERSTLNVLLPLYALYLLLLALWPTTVPFQDWQRSVSFQELTFDQRIVFTFRFIEIIGAFTLLGYMVAEMRGRKKESLWAALGWPLVIVMSCFELLPRNITKALTRLAILCYSHKVKMTLSFNSWSSDGSPNTLLRLWLADGTGNSASIHRLAGTNALHHATSDKATGYGPRFTALVG